MKTKKPEAGKFECDICKTKLATKRNLTRHIEVHAKAHLKKCPYCNFKARIDNIKRHEKTVHKDIVNKATADEANPDDSPSTSAEEVDFSTVELIEDDDDEKEWKPEDHYEIADKRVFRSRKWNTTQADYKITVKPLPTENWQEKLLQIMQHLLDTVREKAPKGAMGRIAIIIDGLESNINQRTSKIELLTAQDLVDRIEAVLNSNDEVDLAKGFRINIIFTDMPSGGTATRTEGPRRFDKRTITDTDTWTFNKLSILNPAANAKDDLCLARCLVVSMAMANHESIRDVNDSPVNFKYLYDSRKPMQGQFARQLHKDANVTEGKCGIPELQKFQDFLSDYQIIVFFDGDRIMFEGPPSKQRLLLFFSNDHYRVINPGMMKGYLGKDNYCPKCHDNWNGSGANHKCSMSGCPLCKVAECLYISEDKDVRVCDKCDLSFPSVGCFVEHLKEQCLQYALCPNCNTKQFRDKLDPVGFKPCISLPLPEDYHSLHNCLENRCMYCNKYYLPGHHPHCYVQKPADKKEKKADQPDENAEEGVYELFGEREFVEGYEDDNLNESKKKTESSHRFIYADFEAETRRAQHRPNLLCLEDENGKLKTYRGPKCAKNFVKDCFQKPQKRKHSETQDEGPQRKRAKEDKGFQNCTFVFHNFSGYDGYHVLKEVHKQKIKPSVIFRQSRLLSMRIPQRKIKFMDSFLHMPMALSAMPRAYGFEDKKKGHFPYKMATKENRKYKGPFPPLEAFDVDNMSTKGRAETTEWHETEKKRYDENGLIYDFRKQNEAYCRNDVSIDRQGSECYRQRMMDLFDGLDPFDFCTLPSFCNNAYRKLHMEPNSIGIIPPRGYGTVKHSESAIAWLEWHSHRLGLPIYHARNSAEIKIGKYKVDGFMFTHSGGAVVFEYHGCDFHGHSCKCDRTKKFFGQTMDERAQYTKEKEEFLEKLGYKLIKIYSCEFWKKFSKPDDVELEKEQETGNTEADEALKEKIRAENWQMKEFVKPLLARLRKTTPLCPRDAVRGGRTNCLRKFYKPSLLEMIKYFDINSLYPSVNFSMNGELWPIGHPRKYLHSFPKVDEIFGLIKGTFKPPAELYHPVLGVQANGKLVYGLCEKCIHEGATQHCSHAEEKRYIYGTYVSEEVKLALSKGYEIVSIDEVWHWPPEQRSTTLFRDFIARAYREKTEASGWPVLIQAEIEAHGLQDAEVQAEIQAGGLEGKPIKDFPLKTRQLLEQKGRDHPDVWPLIEAHVAKVKTETGVEIRPEFVEKNPARRSAAKLVLNNFWGFWAKENNPDQTTYCNDIAEFYKLLATKDVGLYYPVNEDIMVVNWKEFSQMEKADSKANVVLAAFTTAYARKRLYSFLEVAGDRVLYMDTDSIIWIDRPGEPQIETGELLGEMKDEILDEYGPSATIAAYGGAGAKTYTLLITDKNTGEVIDTKRKMKGIKPTAIVDEQLPAEKLLDLIQKEYSIKVPQRILRRDKKEATLTWMEMSKVVRSTFSKRLPPKELADCTDPIGSRSHELVPYVVYRQTELLLDLFTY